MVNTWGKNKAILMQSDSLTRFSASNWTKLFICILFCPWFIQAVAYQVNALKE